MPAEKLDDLPANAPQAAQRERTLKAKDLMREERKRRELEAETKGLVEQGLPPPVLDLDDDAEEAPVAREVGGQVVTGYPDWARVPADFPMPAGWIVWFFRFRARWTNTPGRGERQCICWNLSDADEKLAGRRAKGDGARIIDEMAKQMIRAADGHQLSADARETFWNEIGGKCRHLLKSHYLKTHTLDEKENADFYGGCIASRTVG